jgi:hypothetical protein
MNFGFGVVLIEVVFMLLCQTVVSAERYFTEEQISAEGNHCVTGFFSNLGAREVCVKFYDGNAADLNSLLAKFVSPVDPKDAPFVPRFVSRKVVMHPVHKRVTRLDRPNRIVSANWSVTTWNANSRDGKEIHLVVDVYAGGGMNVDEVNVPEEFEFATKQEVNSK